MDTSPTAKLLQRYDQILSERNERFGCDDVFGGAKYLFEKALLDEIARVHEPTRAERLQVMYIELASFVPQKDYELIEQLRRRGEQDPEIKQVLDLISLGDHETIQNELNARALPELVRYYALYRRILRESEARRKQALSVQTLNADADS
jgi:hypothetical protein